MASTLQARPVYGDGSDSTLHLTLEDNLITFYTKVDRNGNLCGATGQISLQHLRAVVLNGKRLVIETPNQTWTLQVASESEAQHWAEMVEEASAEWARRETRSSVLRAIQRMKDEGETPPALPEVSEHTHMATAGAEASSSSPPASPSAKQKLTEFEGYLDFVTETRFQTKRNTYYAVLGGDAQLRLYESLEAASQLRASKAILNLSEARSVELDGDTVHVITPSRTCVLSTVNSYTEAAKLARAVSAHTEARVRMSDRALDHLMEEQESLQSSEYENVEDLMAARELHNFIHEAQEFQHVFKGSSIVYAGFMYKLRGVGLRAWQRRFFVLHNSGVLRYYDQAWAPGSHVSPKKHLLITACDGVEYGPDMTVSTRWPADVPPERRLAIVFPSRTYFLYCDTAQACKAWVAWLQDVSGLSAAYDAVIGADPLLEEEEAQAFDAVCFNPFVENEEEHTYTLATDMFDEYGSFEELEEDDDGDASAAEKEKAEGRTSGRSQAMPKRGAASRVRMPLPPLPAVEEEREKEDAAADRAPATTAGRHAASGAGGGHLRLIDEDGYAVVNNKGEREDERMPEEEFEAKLAEMAEMYFSSGSEDEEGNSGADDDDEEGDEDGEEPIYAVVRRDGTISVGQTEKGPQDAGADTLSSSSAVGRDRVEATPEAGPPRLPQRSYVLTPEQAAGKDAQEPIRVKQQRKQQQPGQVASKQRQLPKPRGGRRLPTAPAGSGPPPSAQQRRKQPAAPMASRPSLEAARKRGVADRIKQLQSGMSPEPTQQTLPTSASQQRAAVPSSSKATSSQATHAQSQQAVDASSSPADVSDEWLKKQQKIIGPRKRQLPLAGVHSLHRDSSVMSQGVAAVPVPRRVARELSREAAGSTSPRRRRSSCGAHAHRRHKRAAPDSVQSPSSTKRDCGSTEQRQSEDDCPRSDHPSAHKDPASSEAEDCAGNNNNNTSNDDDDDDDGAMSSVRERVQLWQQRDRRRGHPRKAVEHVTTTASTDYDDEEDNRAAGKRSSTISVPDTTTTSSSTDAWTHPRPRNHEQTKEHGQEDQQRRPQLRRTEELDHAHCTGVSDHPRSPNTPNSSSGTGASCNQAPQGATEPGALSTSSPPSSPSSSPALSSASLGAAAASSVSSLPASATTSTPRAPALEPLRRQPGVDEEKGREEQSAEKKEGAAVKQQDADVGRSSESGGHGQEEEGGAASQRKSSVQQQQQRLPTSGPVTMPSTRTRAGGVGGSGSSTQNSSVHGRIQVGLPRPRAGAMGRKSGESLRAGQPAYKTEVVKLFKAFLQADDFATMHSNFKQLLHVTRLVEEVHSKAFYAKLKAAVLPYLNYKQRNIFKTIDEQRSKMSQKYNTCIRLAVAVIGAGPVGLRTAIGMALLDAQVTVLERRTNFTRYNILHLWDWVCADLISLGANPSDILGKSFFHIGTKNLQMMLCRMALMLGVQLITGVQAINMAAPLEDDPNPVKLWRLEAQHLQQGVRLFVPCHVLYVACGASDGITERLGFRQVEMGTSNAMGLVAHWENRKTSAERRLEEFSWASQYNQKLFSQLAALGCDLENVVYYQGETHYFVMTPKKASLLESGVLRENRATPAEILESNNVDKEQLRAYAQTVASFFEMPSDLPIHEDAGIALFDFSSRRACKTSSRVLVDGAGRQAVVMVIGDALLEPFWPEGLGINRGFHTAFDAMFVVQLLFSTGYTQDPEEIVRVRQSLFEKMKGLSAFTKSNIVNSNFKAYDLDPRSRYKLVQTPRQGDVDNDEDGSQGEGLNTDQERPFRLFSVSLRGRQDGAQTSV